MKNSQKQLEKDSNQFLAPSRTSAGFNFYSTVLLIRGCDETDAFNCTKITVNKNSTTHYSVSLNWSVADRGDRVQFGIAYQKLTIVNEEHPTQLGVVTANQIDLFLANDIRQFVSNNSLTLPGVLYKFELK